MYVNWTFRPQWDANQARALINVTLSTTTTTTITIATTIITITASTTIIDTTVTTLVTVSHLNYVGFYTSVV